MSAGVFCVTWMYKEPQNNSSMRGNVGINLRFPKQQKSSSKKKDQEMKFRTHSGKPLLLASVIALSLPSLAWGGEDVQNQPQQSSPAQASAMRNMAKIMGPEAALDMMFSSIDPFCQKSLLSKSTEPAKAPESAEDMREDRYFQPAIVVGNQMMQWAKALPGGRQSHTPAEANKNPYDWWRIKSANEPAATNQTAKRY